ncbi:MAG: carbamoyltransferase HypF [Anaerolineales bacterium]
MTAPLPLPPSTSQRANGEEAWHVYVRGVVQGVGFRPFVYNLATQLQLRGWVRNTSAGVEMLLCGPGERLRQFIENLHTQAPPLARIEDVQITPETSLPELQEFTIHESLAQESAFQPVAADVAICADCERELLDPNDRRYLYPFITCTHCGPRFTIIRDLPYDRPLTTMADFPLCEQCAQEYHNPSDRRFHAQPIACPKCGPMVQFCSPGCEREVLHMSLQLEAILSARRWLRLGKILAIKGLGGFHLACDATHPQAVAALRRRKGRAEKPFALMAADLATIERFCEVSAAERELLLSRQRPIVLLRKREGIDLPGIAPGLDRLGIMLPYTPLHLVLLNQHDPRLRREAVPPLLVMTSGNLSEEPIAIDNEEAWQRLHPLVDAFLIHNRPIQARCDDSVVSVASAEGKTFPVFLRRSRGYAPEAIQLPFSSVPLLAVGGELKNTFCLVRERYAFLSAHIGDLENYETFQAFEQAVRHFEHLFRVSPQRLACDLHPTYLSTRYARERAEAEFLPLIQVQHHHAHIAACMAEAGLAEGGVIGLAYDGTGYGIDGHIWGGEVLLASYTSFERAAHPEYLPLPGGDAAIRHPWRIAYAYLLTLGLETEDLPFLSTIPPQARRVVRAQWEQGINLSLTSSLGRLFDAVAALCGIRNQVNYEAQAAMELEVQARRWMEAAPPYPYLIEIQDGQMVWRLRPTFEALLHDLRHGLSAGEIGARFHRTVLAWTFETCKRVREVHHLDQVALSGGVWQNEILLENAIAGLKKQGFRVYWPRRTPFNDGALCLGQAAVAAHQSP